MGRKLIDLTNKRFGRLKALYVFEIVKGGALWHCVCDCGNVKNIYGHVLRAGRSKSCGCLRSERSSELIRKLLKENPPSRLQHGEAKAGQESPEWKVWHSIKSRCKDHIHYGGRGIKMCERWLNSFEDFLADVGRRPSQEYSLDRYPDNDGDYELGNVRWATSSQQARNRRNTVYIEYDGMRLPLVEWAERLELKPDTLRGRLQKWSIERALKQPAKKQAKTVSRIVEREWSGTAREAPGMVHGNPALWIVEPYGNKGFSPPFV